MLDKKAKNIKDYARGEGVEYPDDFCIFDYLLEISQNQPPEQIEPDNDIDKEDYEDDPRLPDPDSNEPEEPELYIVEDDDDCEDDPCLSQILSPSWCK